MTVKLLRPVLTSVTCMVISFVWFGCSSLPAGGGSQRKKMLDLTSGNGTGDCAFAGANNSTAPFSTIETSMLVNGINTNMVSVAVPNAAYDSIALANVQNILPFAYPLLNQWAQQKKGVVIDFCSHANNGKYRVDYVLEAPGSFSIPVVLLYDQWSACRAGTAVNLMYNLPVTCKPVMGYEGQDKRLRQSAF